MHARIASATPAKHVVPRIAKANSWFSRIYCGLLASFGFTAFLLVSAPALAATAPPLGAVQSFAVLGGASVTATPPAGTVIDGDVGSAPTSTVNGFGPAVVTAGFTVYTADNAATANARTAATAAFGNLAGQVCPAGLPNNIAGGILDGLNLGPGVYCMPTGSLTGTLTLTGGPTDVWVFQMTTDTLTTAAASKVVMAGGASACNVYWQISSSATLGGGASEFSGSIFSGVSISIGATAKVIGRAIAGSGAVTMDGSNTVGGCSAAADLAITKTDGVASVNAGGSTTYTITVTNNGPSSVTAAILSDAAAAGLSKTAVVCSGTPGQCAAAPTVAELESGTFALPALASGQTYQITVTANVTAISGSVSNIATVAVPGSVTDSVPANNSATDTDAVNAMADLSITKTDGVPSVNAGGSTTYTITVANNGPSSVTAAILSDALAAGLSKTVVACSAGTPGQCVTAPTVAELQSGTFALPALASGQTYQITVAANVTAIGGNVSNIATVAVPGSVTDSVPANNSSTDTDAVNAVADLSITKTDGVASVNAGGSTTYTITVTNNGPSSVTAAILSDALAAGLSKTVVACSAGTPGQCVTAPTVAELQSGTFPLPALASGQTYQITVAANVTAISGNVSNIATVAVPGSVTDSVPANNSATDTDAVNSVTITVTKISNGGISSFSFTGDNGFANQTIATLVSGVGVAGATQTLTAAGAVTTITESAPPAGFVLASINCSGLGAGGTATPNIVARNVVLNAAATAAGAAIACTFTNVAVVPNSITIVKNAVGGNGTFAYTGTNGIAGFNITTASGSGSNAITALAVGSYTITEIPVPVGWNLTNLQCLGAATPVAITGGQAVITLAAGEAVVCTYTNTKQGSITVNKTAVGGDSTFNYTGAQSFSITTAGGTGSNTTAFTSVVPGTYNVTETVPAGWNLTGLTCSNGSAVTVGTATANVAVAAGEAVTCTFTNNLLLPLPAAGIPTLSEWAMILLASLLAIVGFAAMRRQAR